MHPKVYKAFEEILYNNKITGNVLEIGAVPSQQSLLTSKYLSNAEEKIGLNIEKTIKFKDYTIIKGNSNNMIMFKDNHFDCILCNAVLEHDKFFWKTLAEINRVLKTNGLLIIGTPSFRNFMFSKFTRNLGQSNFITDFLRNTTFCFKIHDAPGDYYRFSEQSFKEFIFDGFNEVNIKTIMVPPRTIGYGFKK